MQIVRHHNLTPEENIAFDELLLEKAEKGETGETLRFWSSRGHFIVTGRSSKVADDCHLRSCHRNNVRIIRRISGGGTVLQGAGCLNYSLVLSYDRDPDYRNISTSYRSILGGIMDTLKPKGVDAGFAPLSDLTLDGKKFSGNAQARKHRYFLHHGTFLYDFDLEIMRMFLKHPGREPAYRKKRAHEEFLTNIPLSGDELKDVVAGAFCPTGVSSWEPSSKDITRLGELVRKKFTCDSWNYCF